MLMYRRIDKKKNLIEVKVDDIPEGLRKRVTEENERYKKKIEEKEREREMIKLKVHYEQQPEQLLKVEKENWEISYKMRFITAQHLRRYFVWLLILLVLVKHIHQIALD